MFEYQIEIPNETGELVTRTVKAHPFDRMPIGLRRKNRKSDEESMWAMIEWGISGEDLDLFDQATSDQLEKFMAAWQQAAGVTVGESTAS